MKRKLIIDPLYMSYNRTEVVQLIHIQLLIIMYIRQIKYIRGRIQIIINQHHNVNLCFLYIFQDPCKILCIGCEADIVSIWPLNYQNGQNNHDIQWRFQCYSQAGVQWCGGHLSFGITIENGFIYLLQTKSIFVLID